VIENCFITTAENTKVEIGNHCMFVSNNQIKCHDYHPIFNVQTGQRVNTSQSIIIGNHVLLEPSAILLASAVVNDGSIISQGSIVKSEIPKSSMAAGIPARVVKQKITWDRAAWKSSGAF
jgi:acetyltransferase-like isoleucine patch superfamily enzyme